MVRAMCIVWVGPWLKFSIEGTDLAMPVIEPQSIVVSSIVKQKPWKSVQMRRRNLLFIYVWCRQYLLCIHVICRLPLLYRCVICVQPLLCICNMQLPLLCICLLYRLLLLCVWGWLCEGKVSCSFCHQGAQLILAYSWERRAVLAAGKWGMLLFLLFLHFLSFPSFFIILLFHLHCYIFISFLPLSGSRHKMTHKDWPVVKPQQLKKNAMHM